MTIASSVTVMEVSPRDGLQNESVILSTDDKLTLIHRAPLTRHTLCNHIPLHSHIRDRSPT